MIQMLYDKFRHWSENGSVYIISDTHFEDNDCKIMDPKWITPQEHIDIIKQTIKKNDTLICLGDCGNLEWFNQIKAKYKVLIKGNHDDKGNSLYLKYFDEVYEGPLFIAPKILLSHEPIEGLEWCVNIHGHNHSCWTNVGINLAANVYNFQVFNLGKEIKKGLVSQIPSIHRVTINKAIERIDKIWIKE